MAGLRSEGRIHVSVMLVLGVTLVVLGYPGPDRSLSAAVPWEPSTICTVAGTGVGGYGGDGGAATSAQLYGPFGVAVDSAGNIFIADKQNSRIRKVNTSGTITTVAGTGTPGYGGDGGPATATELNYPFGVAVDGAGNLFIADTLNHRIRKVNTSGFISTVAGTGTPGYGGDGGPATSAQLYCPYGVAVDSAGNIFIADRTNNRIRKVNTSGTITTVAGTGTRSYNGDGGAATSAQVNDPIGVALDSAGNIFIADSGNNRIRKVNTSGIITTVAGTGSYGYGGDGGAATGAHLGNPTGLTLDSAGNIFIADCNNFRVRKVDASGTITTVAGTGTRSYSGDGGAATSADLGQAYGVAVDGAGNRLFIADGDNSRIRMVVRRADLAVPSVTVTVPAATHYRVATMPAAFSGSAADDSAGVGLDVNSTAFTLQRTTDSRYWNGISWETTAAWLATSHGATSDGSTVNWTSNVTMPAWTDGSYKVQARATDKGANSGTGNAVTFTFDNTQPVITFNPMLGFTGPLQAQQIGWSATDANIAPNSAALEGFDGTSWAPIATGQPIQGNYAWTVPPVNVNTARVRVTVADLAGNTTTTESWTFVIDSTNPAVNINDIAVTVNNLPLVGGASSDPAPGQMDKVQVVVNNTTAGTYWDGSGWAGTETWLEAYRNSAGTGWAFPMPTLANNNGYTVKARAMDRARNISLVATDSFTFQAAATLLRGDANGDGQLNALDITAVERMIAGLD